MGVISIESFIGGLSNYDDRGARGQFQFGYGLDIRKKIDSLSCGQAFVYSFGKSAGQSPSLSVSPSASVSMSPSSSISPSLHPGSASLSPSASMSPSASISPSNSTSPSPSPTTADNSYFDVFRDMIIVFVNGSDGYLYGFGDNGYVYRRDTSGFWEMIFYTPHGRISGASEMNFPDGTHWMYFATDSNILKKPLPGRNDWNDVVSGGNGLVHSFWHTMVRMSLGLVIANGSKLLMIFRADNSIQDNALEVDPLKIMKTILDRNAHTIIGTTPSNDLYGGVNAAIDTEFQVSQIGNTGDIYMSDTAHSSPVNHFYDPVSYVNPGAICATKTGGVFYDWDQLAEAYLGSTTINNIALMGVTGAQGYLYSFGRHSTDSPFALNLDAIIGGDEIGALALYNGQRIASVKFNESPDLFLVSEEDLNTKAQASYWSLPIKAPIKYPIQLTQFTQIELIMKPLPAGCSVQAAIQRTEDQAYFPGYVDDQLTTSVTQEGVTKAIFNIGPVDAEAVQLNIVMNPSGNVTPEILKARLYYV